MTKAELIVPNISWKENKVFIIYSGAQLSFEYSSLPDTDLVIPGVDLDEFNQMLDDLRYNPEKFVRNFKGRNDDPPGYQRCRALLLARIYSDKFEIVSQSFCTLAYRYLYDGLGTIDELGSLYKDLQGFKEFNDPYSGKFSYRWITSIWTALAHCYIKEGDAEAAFKIFNKIHSFADIKLWPAAIVNILGACYVTGKDAEYSRKIYETAIHEYEIVLVDRLSEIIAASAILETIMGKENVKCPRLYTKANDLLKNYI